MSTHCIQWSARADRKMYWLPIPEWDSQARWGFSPFGVVPEGETMTKSGGHQLVEIYVVNCPVNSAGKRDDPGECIYVRRIGLKSVASLRKMVEND